MNKNKILNFAFILFVGIGICLRFYNLRYNSQFTWDQDYFSFAAKDIVINRHFPMVGGSTSTGNIHIGPLYSYLLALLFVLLQMDPISVSLLSGVVSVSGMIIGYVLVRKVFHRDAAFFFVLIAAVSPFLLRLDRTPWNVNLFPIATILFCSGLWLAQKQVKIGFLMTGIGFFLGFNSQLSVLFYVASFTYIIMTNEKLRNKNLIYSLVGLGIGVLPLLIFNFRHQNMLLSNTGSLLQNSTVSPEGYIARLISVTLLQLQLIAQIIFTDASSHFQQMVGIAWVCILLVHRKNVLIAQYLSVFIPSFVFFLLGYSLYSGQLPEYYFMGIITLGVIGWGILFHLVSLRYKQSRLLFLILFSLYALESVSNITPVNPQSLGIKQEIVQSIQRESKNTDFSVNYDMEFGLGYGFDYLFDYNQLGGQKKESSPNIFWISFPKSRYPGLPDEIISDFAIGYPKTSETIFKTKNADFYDGLFKLRIPKDWGVAQCPNIDFDFYVLGKSNAISCGTRGEMQIFNIPVCLSSKYDKSNQYTLKNGMVLSEYGSDQFARKTLEVSFEKGRCIQIVFDATSGVSPEITTILESIKRGK